MTHSHGNTSKHLMAVLATSLAVSTMAFSAEGHFQRTLPVTGAVDLSIQAGAGSVTVRTGGNSTVEVRGTIQAWRGLFSNAEARKSVAYLESHPPIEQHGDVIRVGYSAEPRMQHNVSISYELVVPASTRLRCQTGSGSQAIGGISGPLEVASGSGSIRASNIGTSVEAHTGSGTIVLETVKEGVRASTGSGSIRATGVEGSVRVSTGSGSVTVEQTGVADARVTSASGNIVLRKVRGLVHAKTTSGSITAEGGGQSPWYLETVSGRISVRVPPNVGFNLHAHTVSGSISTNRPLTLQGAVGRREITGKAGNGGFLLDVSTVSGNIHVDWVA